MKDIFAEVQIMLHIQPYTKADYDDFVRINEATQSQAFWGEADWHPIHPPCNDTPDAKRYIAVDTASSQTVGYGAILWARQTNIDVMVDPAWQRRGVGTKLWEHMRQNLSRLGSATVGPWVRAQNIPACHWLESLGFTHVDKDGPVQLIVDSADTSSSGPLTKHLAEYGVTITTLAAEQAHNPDCLTAFYALFQEVEKDVLGYSPENRTSYEQCVAELEKPGMLPEAVFIARHNEDYVGLSILGQKVSPDDVRFAGGLNCLSQHLTGVRREYRRQGIARALKLHTIEYAQQHNFHRILSNSDNPAMRALNWNLGFRTGPWLIYHKAIG